MARAGLPLSKNVGHLKDVGMRRCICSHVKLLAENLKKKNFFVCLP